MRTNRCWLTFPLGGGGGGKTHSPSVFLATVGTKGLALSATAAEVLGHWTFNSSGTAAEIADGTEFPNHVKDSPLSLKAKVQTWPGLKADAPAYLEDVPAAWLFGDAALTNVIGSMSSSVRLVGNGDSDGWGHGCGLEIANFGEVIGADSSWTVELIVRGARQSPDGTYTSGDNCPLLGVGSHSEPTYPGIAVSSENKLVAWRNTQQQTVHSYLQNDRLSRRSWRDGRWRTVMLTWDAEAKVYRFHSDYQDSYTDTGDRFKTSGADFGGQSVLRIGGVWDSGSLAYMLGRLDVAAIRVSRGCRPWYGGMMPWNEEVPRQLVHYRFDGENGATASGLIPNALAPDFDFTGCQIGTPQSWGDNSPFATLSYGSVSYTNDVFAPWLQVQASKDTPRQKNTGALSSFVHGEAVAGGMPLMMQNLPAYFAESFTLEFVVRIANENGQESSQPSVPFFSAPATAKDPEKGIFVWNQQNVFSVGVRQAGGFGPAFKTAWNELSISRDVWHSFALTYDKAQGQVSCYYDGVRVAGKDLSGAIDAAAPIWHDNGLFAQICGVTPNDWVENFSGAIDEFRITRGVLSEADFLRGRRGPGGGLVLTIR